MSNTGTLRIGLNVESDKLVKGLNLGTKQIRRFTRDASRDFSAFSNNTIDSITDIVDAFSGLSSVLSDFGSEFKSITTEAGNSGVALSEFLVLASQIRLAGGDVEDLSDIFGHMKSAIQDASDGSRTYLDHLERMGLDIDKLRRQKPEKVFSQILKAMGNLDEYQRNLAQDDLFGGAFDRYRGFFKEHSFDVNEATKEVEKLGVAYNELTVTTFSELQKEAKLTGLVLKNSLADGLTPTVQKLTELIKNIREWASENKELSSTLLVGSTTVVAFSIGIAGLVGAFKLVAIPFKWFWSGLKKLKVPLSNASKYVKTLSGSLAHLSKARSFLGLTSFAGVALSLSNVLSNHLIPNYREFMDLNNKEVSTTWGEYFGKEFEKLKKRIESFKEIFKKEPIIEAEPAEEEIKKTSLAIDKMYKEAKNNHKKIKSELQHIGSLGALEDHFNFDKFEIQQIVKKPELQKLIKELDKVGYYYNELINIMDEGDPTASLRKAELHRANFMYQAMKGTEAYTNFQGYDIDRHRAWGALDRREQERKRSNLSVEQAHIIEALIEDGEKLNKISQQRDKYEKSIAKWQQIQKNIADDILFKKQQEELEKQRILEQAKEHRELKLTREQEAEENREAFSYSISQALVTGLESGGVKGAIRSFAEVLRDSARESLIQGISESINQSIGKDIGSSALSFVASIFTGAIFGGGSGSSSSGGEIGIEGYGGGSPFETFNDGGIVKGHGTMDRVPAMLTAGEIVINPRKTDLSQLGSKTTNITYNIHAVDSRSFQQLVAEDPEFIHNVAQQGQRDTTSLRRT